MSIRDEFVKWSAETFGAIIFGVFFALLFGVMLVFGIQEQTRPVKPSEVCTYEWFLNPDITVRHCWDAGSPGAARATETAVKTTQAMYAAQTATAAPVVIQRGDVTIYRYFDQETEQYIYICTPANTYDKSNSIPCTAGER